MKRRHHDAERASTMGLDAQAIDKLYGLEPLFEPGADTRAGAIEFVTIVCPYCGEHYDTQLDLSNGSFVYVEDCQVCCQPIELSVTLNDDSELLALEARRAD